MTPTIKNQIRCRHCNKILTNIGVSCSCVKTIKWNPPRGRSGPEVLIHTPNIPEFPKASTPKPIYPEENSAK